MKKSAIAFLVLFLSTLAQAAPNTQAIPYYGEKFYSDLGSGVSNEDLISNIKTVLRSSHRKMNGSFDQISDNCSGSDCYEQTSLGYDGARVFLMGRYYLVDTKDGSYGVRDVYCDVVKTRKDFNSRDVPAPNVIPDNNVINTEHTWPQSRFSGKHRKEIQKADLHHLFPTDTQANSARGNFEFGEVVKDSHSVRCPASHFGSASDGRGQVFEPPRNHRGNVARALFYFSLRYDLPIGAREEAVLRKWSKDDPVDEDELSRNNAIFKVQSNRNPFIDFPALEEKISNF